MKRKLVIFNICFLSAFLIFVTGCATTKGKKAGEESQVAVITGVEISDNKINITGDRPFTYTIYKSSDPYKVIVELPDVSLGSFTGKIKSDMAGITEINPYQTDNPMSARMEILLSSPADVESEYVNNSLSINIKGEPEVKIAEIALERQNTKEDIPEIKIQEEKPEVSDVPSAIEQKVMASAAETKKEETITPKPRLKSLPKEFPPATEIVKVSVDKEPGVVKVVIKGNGSLNPNVFRLDNRAILDIPKVELKASMPSAVPDPIKNIRSGKHKDKTRLVLDLKEGTNFDVAAIEDSVIVSFRVPEEEKPLAKKTEKTKEPETKVAVVPPPDKQVTGKYAGQRISLDFQNADIVPIFRLLADISGYNFVIDPAVRGNITMKLMNVPWDQALDIILQTFSLGKSIDGNIIWIAPVATFAKMAKEKTEAKDVEEKAEDLMQEIIRINYATASEINTAITQGKLLSTRGSISTDTRMNTLIIKDTQKSIEKIKDLVKIMDVAKPQVMIEARIVSVSSDYSESLGIRWGGTFEGAGTQNLGDEVRGGFSVNTPVALAGPTTTNRGGVLGMTIGSASNVQVRLSLSALETIGKAKTLSNPKILTLDNESATIQQGQSFFVPTISDEGTKAEEKTATLSLTVKPKITPEGYVQLDVTASDDSLRGGVGGIAAVIDKKSLTTKALVKNGETLVLGGIYTTSMTETEEGVPLLSKIPILGWLFKTRTLTGPNVRELLIFITPTIVEQQRI